MAFPRSAVSSSCPNAAPTSEFAFRLSLPQYIEEVEVAPNAVVAGLVTTAFVVRCATRPVSQVSEAGLLEAQASL